MISVTVIRINSGDISIFESFQNNKAYAILIVFAALVF